MRELVLDDPAPFVPFFLTKRKKEIDYEAKAVTLAGRRYIVCRNHDQMRKDAAARAAILAALERELKKGDKALVGNKDYRRFLMKPDDGHFAIDQAKAEEDAKFDGVFVPGPMPGCRRSKRCSSTSSYGRWSGRSAHRRACSKRGRFITNSTRPSAATSPAVSSPWC